MTANMATVKAIVFMVVNIITKIPTTCDPDFRSEWQLPLRSDDVLAVELPATGLQLLFLLRKAQAPPAIND